MQKTKILEKAGIALRYLDYLEIGILGFEATIKACSDAINTAGHRKYQELNLITNNSNFEKSSKIVVKNRENEVFCDGIFRKKLSNFNGAGRRNRTNDLLITNQQTLCFNAFLYLS
ncbi:hypothetical protein FACS189472_11140 [Alphaproteobacteria bacterium]|nr:hypothetical protein FACS189472_11140 [Alphaproteobacteria bacterium]